MGSCFQAAAETLRLGENIGTEVSFSIKLPAYSAGVWAEHWHLEPITLGSNKIEVAKISQYLNMPLQRSIEGCRGDEATAATTSATVTATTSWTANFSRRFIYSDDPGIWSRISYAQAIGDDKGNGERA